MNKEISLSKLRKMFLSKLWLVVILAIVGGVGANYCASNMVTPTYASTSIIYIYNAGMGNPSGQLSPTNMAASQGALQLYLVLYKTTTVLETTANTIDEYREGYLRGDDKYSEYSFLAEKSYTPAQIGSMITANQANETELLSITTVADDPRVAKLITTIVTDVLQYEIPKMIGATSNKVVQKATFSATPIGPLVGRMTSKGAFVGALIAAAIIMIKLMADTVVRTDEDLVENFPDIPVLGVIPKMDGSGKAKKYSRKKARK